MNDYAAWANRHPMAARELADLLATLSVQTAGAPEGSETRAQQEARLSVASQGAYAWRNNVGATPAKCPDCQAKQRPVRYGLANESIKLNEKIKSSDLILAIPRVITPDMVGSTMAQFGAVECKRPGWRYTGKGREVPQAAWLALIIKLGGFATFSTGEVRL